MPMGMKFLTVALAPAMQIRLDAGDPLRGENQRVMGTIKLYEAKTASLVRSTVRWGRIAQLLSAQILAGQYERQKRCSRSRK